MSQQECSGLPQGVNKCMAGMTMCKQKTVKSVHGQPGSELAQVERLTLDWGGGGGGRGGSQEGYTLDSI